MKLNLLALVVLSVVFSQTASADIGSPTSEKYRARFTHFACKSFKDKADAPEFLQRLNLSFGHLGVDQTLDNAILNLLSTNEDACEYRAAFARNRQTLNLDFKGSQMNGPLHCQSMKDELDPVFEAGFKYAAKYMYYFALKFNDNFNNNCENVSGNFIAEFELGL